MEKPRVKCEIHDGIAEVMLTRGDKLNALDRAMFSAIDETLTQLARHKGLRAVILHGEGRAFCAGLDVKSMLKQPVAALDILKREADEATNLAQRVAYGWHQLPVPVIAVTQGVCFGGGLQIALGADFRFSTPDCRFSVMEIKWGIIPDMSGSVTMRNLMGLDTAMERARAGCHRGQIPRAGEPGLRRSAGGGAGVCPHPYHQIARCPGGDQAALQPGLGSQR